MRSDQASWARRVVLALGVVGCALVLAGWAAPARADVAIGCPVPGATGTSPTSNVDTSGISIALEYTMPDGSTHSESGTTIDLDGDGVTDLTTWAWVDAGWEAHPDWDFWTDTWTSTWYSYPIANMAAYSSIDDVLRDRAGIDYSDYVSATTTWAGGDPIVYPGGSTSVLDAYKQMLLTLRVTRDESSTATMPTSVTAHVVVPRVDESGASVGNDEYLVGFDVSGSAGAENEWAPTSQATVFLDWMFRNVAALGLDTYDSAGTRLPWSNLSATVDVEMIEGETTEIAGKIGFTGEYGETTSGAPGSGAVALDVDCGTVGDPTAVPADTLVAGYDASAAGARLPEALAAELHTGATSAETTVEVAIDSPPAGLDLRTSAQDADVDGDGTTDDAVDLEGDGDFDAFPWNKAVLRHDGTTSPGVSGVFVTDSLDSSALTDRYIAFDIDALPTAATVDWAGLLATSDSDGDGTADTVTSTIDRAEVRMCEVTWVSWVDSACTTPLGTTGTARLSLRTELPAADADGGYTAEFGSFPSAPDDIVATAADHFDIAPGDFVHVVSPAGGPITTVDAVLSGLQEVVVDRRSTLEVDLRASGLGAVGVAAELTTGPPWTAATTSVWGVLADMPDVVSLSADLAEVDEDGDARALSWELADATGTPARTGVAAALETRPTLPILRGLEAHVSGWVGTGDGTTDGLPGSATLTLDLEGDEKQVAWDASGAAALEVAGALASGADRAVLGTPYVTRLYAETVVPESVTVYLSTQDGQLVRADATTCPTVFGLGGCPALATTAIATRKPGVVDAHSLEPGIVVIPAIPDADGVPDEAFPDFSEVTDHVHAVIRDDISSSGSGSGGGGDQPGNGDGNDGGDDGTADQADASEWGVEVVVSELDEVALARSTPLDGRWSRTDVCIGGDASGGDFGVGLYADLTAGGGAGWGDIVRTKRSLTDRLGLQAEVNVPIGSDGSSSIGDLTTSQQWDVSMQGGETALVETVDEPCDDMSDHAADPAPGEADQVTTSKSTLAGRVQVGTEESVLRTRDLETGTPIDVPTSNGLDLAAHSVDYGGGEEYLALDTGFRFPLPNWLEVRNPLLVVCGGGQQESDCDDEHATFDQERHVQAVARLESNLGSSSGLGDLDAEYISDDTLRSESLTDDLERHANIHLDRLPSDINVWALAEMQPRNGRVQVYADIDDMNGRRLQPVHITYTDEYAPARLGDASESSSALNVVPNYDVSLTDLSSSLEVAGAVLMPKAGNPQSYYGGDCSGWDDTWTVDSHVYPEDDREDWVASGPRSSDELRGQYVHADVDLNRSSSVALQLVGLVDGTGQNGTDEAYDSETSSSVRLAVKADKRVEATVRALLPGFSQHLDQTAYWKNFIEVAEAEACIDADVPVEAELNGLSKVWFGLDGTLGTLTVLQSDRDAGGDATIRFREGYYDDSGTWDYLAGAYYAEGFVKFDPIGSEWYAHYDTERKTIGIIDPSDPDRDAGDITQTSIDLDRLLDTSRWGESGTSGSKVHASFLIDPLFHESLEDEMSDGLGVYWNSTWNAAADSFRTLVPGTYWGDWWTWPSTASPTSASDSSSSLTTSCIYSGTTYSKSSEFGRMADGTTFKVTSLHGGAGRFEALLIAYWATGEVRWVRELVDTDSDAVGCKRWRVSWDLDTTTYDASGIVVLDYTVEHKRAGSWTTDVDDMRLVLDASGNGTEDGGNLTASDSSVAVGETVTFSSSRDSYWAYACVWLPGDGTRWVTPDGEDPNAYSHAYAFPGTYRVFQLCYPGSLGGLADWLHDTTVTVTG